MSSLPLRLSFRGTDTILALGARYPNELTIEIANISLVDAIVFEPGGETLPTLTLSADVQPPGQRRDWALGTASEVASISAGIMRGWQSTFNQQGDRPEWKLTPFRREVLEPGASFIIDLLSVTSSLPEGVAHFTLTSRDVPGFDNTTFSLPVTKSTQCTYGLPLTGGGNLRWEGPGGRFQWTQRFWAHPSAKPTPLGFGIISVEQPTTDIPPEHVAGGVAQSASAEGVVLNDWEALYAVHDQGPGDSPFSFRIVNTMGVFETAGNWLLIASVNGDNSTLELGTGAVLAPNTSYSDGSPLPVGTIVMWSGQLDEIPGGWALCDGVEGRPDLRDRFVVGAGENYAVGQVGGSDEVALTVGQMPSHQHTASTRGAGNHKHWMEGTNASGLAHRKRTISGTTTVDMGWGGGRDSDPNNKQWRGHVNTDTTGNHAHGVVVNPGGGDQPHENRPPFYSLALIIKV